LTGRKFIERSKALARVKGDLDLLRSLSVSGTRELVNLFG
jgi:hypothetical protein